MVGATHCPELAPGLDLGWFVLIMIYYAYSILGSYIFTLPESNSLDNEVMSHKPEGTNSAHKQYTSIYMHMYGRVIIYHTEIFKES